jgi:Cys-tRNA(Pro)/Cys-tRNA(Cys) deacylase
MPADITETPVTRALDELGISYRFFRHAGEVRSLEQAAGERGQKPEQIIRSLLFRLPGGEFVMVLAAGPGQLSWSALREYLNTTRMTTASHAEVLEVTGYPPGAVSPFGLPEPVRILMDKGVLEQEEISIGSGVRNSTVIMSRQDLVKALGEVETGKFVDY